MMLQENLNGSSVRITSSVPEILLLVPEWDELAEHSSDQNVFFESSLLIPALKYLGNPLIKLAIVRAENGELIGLAPLAFRKTYHRIPLRHVSIWRHVNCFDCTPLVKRGKELDFFSLLFNELQKEPALLVQFPLIQTEGEVARQMRRCAELASRRIFEIEGHDRPLLMMDHLNDQYLDKVINSKYRKTLRKRFRQLEEAGTLETSEFKVNDDPDGWISEFLHLEASGWKGRERTAIILHDDQKKFFEEAVKNSVAKNRFNAQKLTLDGRAIAMRVEFSSKEGAFSFKVAYDEDFSRHSPGIHLELFNINQREKHHRYQWIDSCSAPGHSALSGIWASRRKMSSYEVSLDSAVSKATVDLLKKARLLKRNTRLQETVRLSSAGQIARGSISAAKQTVFQLIGRSTSSDQSGSR